jgi:hypothetical protein
MCNMHCSGAAAGHGHWVSGPKGIFTFRNEYNSLARSLVAPFGSYLAASIHSCRYKCWFQLPRICRGVRCLEEIIIDAHNMQ